MSLNTEYDLGGAEKGRRETTMPRKDLFATMKRDLDLVHQMWEQSRSEGL